LINVLLSLAINPLIVGWPTEMGLHLDHILRIKFWGRQKNVYRPPDLRGNSGIRIGNIPGITIRYRGPAREQPDDVRQRR